MTADMNVEVADQQRPCKKQRMESLIAKSMCLAKQQQPSTLAVHRADEKRPPTNSNQTRDAVLTTKTPIRRRRGWTVEEDQRLCALVKELGMDWAKIAQAMSNRDRKRCRERYVNHLAPQLTLYGQPWTSDEETRLLELHTKHGNQWTLIALHLGGGRSPDDVKNRFLRCANQPTKTQPGASESSQSAEVANDQKSSRKAKPWSPEESALLWKLVQEHGPQDWFFLASRIPGRTDLQCLQHWYRVLDPTITKGRGSWTPEEDEILRIKVQEHGQKWSLIARSVLPHRLGKQCRERYLNHLLPPSGGGSHAWTVEEEQQLCQLQQQPAYTNKWSLLATKLSSKSENAIKNHWTKLDRRRWTAKSNE